MGLVALAGGPGPAPGSAPVVPGDAIARTLASLGPGFVRTETEHFVILCDGGAEWSRATGLLLERTHDAFDRFMGRMGFAAAAPGAKLECVLIRDHASFKAFAAAQDGVDAGWMGGYYATHTNRIVFYDAQTSPPFVEAESRLEQLDAQAERAAKEASDARRARDSKSEEVYRALAARAREAESKQRRVLADRAAQAGAAKTTHEAAHLLAFNRGLQSRARSYPFWLSEGLAACFEASSQAAARSGRLGPDHDNPVRQREFAGAIAEASLVPLEAFVEMPAASADEDEARVMYAQAHALFCWLYRHERDALAGFFRDLAREPAGTIPPRRFGALFEARFGPPAKVERAFLREAGAEALRLAHTTDDGP